MIKGFWIYAVVHFAHTLLYLIMEPHLMYAYPKIVKYTYIFTALFFPITLLFMISIYIAKRSLIRQAKLKGIEKKQVGYYFKVSADRRRKYEAERK
ncbi:MAG: hypothetical protein R6U96_18580 [Promethearchaeia archaeon]